MQKVIQTRLGPDGNCLQACLASIFELDLGIVPDFALIKTDPDAKTPTWWIELGSWLSRRGYVFVEVQLHADRAFFFPPFDFFCIMAGFTKEGHRHSVVGRVIDGQFEVEWNPSNDGTAGIESVDSICLLVPRDPVDMEYRPLAGKIEIHRAKKLPYRNE